MMGYPYLTALIFFVSLTVLSRSVLASANVTFNDASHVAGTMDTTRKDFLHSNSKTATQAIDCDVANDLVIVLDSSGSIGAGNYHLLKTFVADLTVAFGNRPETRQGLVYYSSSTTILYDLTDQLNTTAMKTAIMEHSYSAGPSNTHYGIKEATRMLLDHARPNVPKKMLVVTDGESTYTTLTKKAAKTARANEITLFALGIGHGFEKELVSIAGGHKGSIFQTFNFTTLSTLLKAVSTGICQNDIEESDGVILLPFGPEAGDEDVAYQSPTCSPKLPSVPMYMGRIMDPFICTEGHISAFYFGEGSLTLRDREDNSCSRKYNHPMMLPYMNYIENSSDGGTVTHRLATDTETLSTLKAILTPVFPDCEYFQLELNWAYIITWFNKTTFASTVTPGCSGLNFRNTIQAITTGGPEQTFTIFLYKKLEWSFPPAGCPGFTENAGPVDSAAGLYTGIQDGVIDHFKNLPGSCSKNILDLGETSNVGSPGMWVYRVDGEDGAEQGWSLDDYSTLKKYNLI